MRNLHNIEKSGFRTYEYVGYATYKGTSTVYRIVKDGNEWRATPIENTSAAPTLRQRTLAAMSDSLSDLALTPKDA